MSKKDSRHYAVPTKDDLINGRKLDWKEHADKIFSPEDAVMVWQQIEPFLPSEGPIRLVSPSSNFPSHEIAIHNYVQKTREITTFSGDIEQVVVGQTIDKLVEPSQHYSSFQHFRWDGEELPFKPETITVIWDRRGVIWHTVFEMLRAKTSQKMENLIAGLDAKAIDKLEEALAELEKDSIQRLFNKFNSLLQKDGIIVLDADEGERIGFGEESTIQFLQYNFGKNFFKNIGLHQNFDLYEGTIGNHKVVVLQKKKST